MFPSISSLAMSIFLLFVYLGQCSSLRLRGLGPSPSRTGLKSHGQVVSIKVWNSPGSQ